MKINAKFCLKNTTSKKTKVKGRLSSEEAMRKIKTAVVFWRVQKWLIIHNALNYPRGSEETVAHLAVSTSLAHKTISEYNRYAASAIETRGKGGRRNLYLSEKEERDFIEGFISEAQKGLIATAGQIKELNEKLIGKTVHKTTIYRLLERNGWRKAVPLSHHPRKDKQAQERFKKKL